MVKVLENRAIDLDIAPGNKKADDITAQAQAAASGGNQTSDAEGVAGNAQAAGMAVAGTAGGAVKGALAPLLLFLLSYFHCIPEELTDVRAWGASSSPTPTPSFTHSLPPSLTTPSLPQAQSTRSATQSGRWGPGSAARCRV